MGGIQVKILSKILVYIVENQTFSLKVYFLSSPEIDFDLGGIANALDAPGLSNIIRNIILEQIGNFIVSVKYNRIINFFHMKADLIYRYCQINLHCHCQTQQRTGSLDVRTLQAF